MGIELGAIESEWEEIPDVDHSILNDIAVVNQSIAESVSEAEAYAAAFHRKAAADPMEHVSDIMPPPLCEDALALEFSRQHGADWRYVAEWDEWLGWDGVRWAKERTLQIHNLARKVCRDVDARNAKSDGTTRGVKFATF